MGAARFAARSSTAVGRFVGTDRIKTTKQATKAEKAKGHTDVTPDTDTAVVKPIKDKKL